MHPLELEIKSIVEEFVAGRITAEEKDYLIQEIRDVRIAQECADNEETARIVATVCNMAMALS